LNDKPKESTLGAIAPNEKTIMGRTGTYAKGAYVNSLSDDTGGVG